MPLERETMIRVALALLNEVGLDGLTVRRLAERLGVQNPALYWHFKNKQELLNEMARMMLADAFAGIKPPATAEEWAQWLAEVAERFRLTLLTYRDGARVIATADLAESALLTTQDLALHVLTTAGFDLRTALVGVVAIFDYTLGAAFEDQAGPDHPTVKSLTTLRSRSLSLDPVRFPHLVAAVDEIAKMVSPDPHVGFNGGIRLLLAGMMVIKPTRCATR